MSRPAITPEAEEIIGGYFGVLDYGFISLKDCLGGDTAIEESARVSYGAGTRTRNETRGLIRYLLRQDHGTPFEMTDLVFHISAPLFVISQWARHRLSSTNQYSGRYSLMPMAFYTPEEWRLQSKSNKQGSAAASLSGDEGANALSHLTRANAIYEYEWLCEQDVARELARIDLPQSTFSQFYWKINLRSLFNFLSLRCDPHAQWEIRVYANIIAGMVKRVAPLAYEAWIDYQFGAANFSRMELQLLSKMFAKKENGEIWPHGNGYLATVDTWDEKAQEVTGLTKREYGEFLSKLEGPGEIPDFDLDLSTMKDGSFFEERMAALVPAVN